jgi:hypothetical protein
VDDAAKLETVKQYLRRKYATNVEGLKTLADRIAESAVKAVTITGQTFEGGSAQGVITFEKLAYLNAVEQLILELDPDNTPKAPPAVAFADFSSSHLET